MRRLLTARIAFPAAEWWTGRKIGSKAQQLSALDRMAFPQRRARALARLAHVLGRAGQEVPYYRDLFRVTRFDPDRVGRDPGYLGELPLLTKDILREQGPRMLSERFAFAALHLRKTGGSTGPAAAVYYDTDSLDWTAAVNIAARRWAGKALGMREVHLASRFPEVFPWRDRVKEHFKCLATNRANIYIDTFEPEGLDRLWRALRHKRPYLLQGHPSTLYALALHLRPRRHETRGVVRVFESTGEVLDAKQREQIESVFGCRVADRFGNAEFGVVAYEPWECADHRLRVLDAVVWPENIAHEGSSPELVLSGLLNEAMPLIRYRTGDLAELSEEPTGFYLSRIVGRVHDVVEIGERKYPTHYLQDLVDRLDGVDEFQVEQQAAGPLRLRLVVPDVARQAAIARRIDAWWGNQVELEFTDFSGLARGGWRNKFRHLVDRRSA